MSKQNVMGIIWPIISITIYALFDAETYVASIVTSDMEYSAPHSSMRRRMG